MIGAPYRVWNEDGGKTESRIGLLMVGFVEASYRLQGYYTHVLPPVFVLLVYMVEVFIGFEEGKKWV